MKKAIVIEILLVAVFAVLLTCAIIALKDIPSMKEYIDWYNTLSPDYPDYDLVETTAWEIRAYMPILLKIGIPALIAAVADLAAITIIAIKDFPVFKPLVDKFKARKEQRAAAKAEQAATAKQERIEKLPAELDELKKGE